MVTIDKIIEYVMNTPCNSNPSVLRGMLIQLIEDNSGSTPPPIPPIDPNDIIVYDGGPAQGWI